ncbi:MAG: isoprenoid biosynthesis glyoxalase ElbB [Rickettsiales bacterium]|nr:isoprenoid biosynthesis glyoxalase ElbB [Rickettsiales bacterium]
MKNIAVILSGCGYLDGAEIRESVLTLLYLDQQGASVQCFAPDIEQMHVVNHLTGEEVASESRNVLTESARIARGEVKDLAHLNATVFDALLIPGGFGVAKNLSDLAIKGADATVNDDFKRVTKDFLSQQKPIGAICIAPAVLAAAVSGDYAPTLTIGDDADTAGAIEAFGGTHQNCESAAYIYDETLKIASCSAYMREDKLANIAKGIEQVVNKVMAAA